MTYENSAQAAQNIEQAYDYTSAILRPSRAMKITGNKQLIGENITGFDVIVYNSHKQYLAGLRAVTNKGSHPGAIQILVQNHSMLFEQPDLAAILSASEEDLTPAVKEIKKHLGSSFSQDKSK